MIQLEKFTPTQRSLRVKEFVNFWKDKGYEKGESQMFWLKFLEQVLSVKNSEQVISFERQVMLDHTSFIDGFINETHVLVEQKSKDVDLRAKVKQSDGSFLTPFQQAKRYSQELPYSERPRWIITCNFHEFLIYDMDKPNCEPESVLLKDLEKEYYRFEFIVNNDNQDIQKEMEVSFKAGELVGRLYDMLSKKYNNLEKDEFEQKSLNILCVRLVFCLYAEDSGIFSRNQFYDYMKSFRQENSRTALKELFKMLDTKIEDRDKYEDEKLLAFPYVNGGLFSDENIEIPQLDESIIATLLFSIGRDFDWSEISPTIFGAVFESTLNPETRRSGGMHYTSIENIHKVIDPLFLNDLREEFDEIKEIAVERTRNNRLKEFQNKIASLTFLDPACGSGNFLTETFISLRKLENEVIKLLRGNQIEMGFENDNPIKVSINQFYGIEINDFAVDVAKTALWISEYQMLKKTESIIKMDLDFLPLKSYDNITLGNALRIDWESVVPKDKLNYIMGNPPFIGYKFQTATEKEEIKNIAVGFENYGTLDYVSCWFIKAAFYSKNTKIKIGFVATNSICQGEHVYTLWKPLFEMGININFAHRTFRWDSESNLKAHVHCVIVGFGYDGYERKYVFENNRTILTNNINGYLLNAPNVFISKHSSPISNNIPFANKGNAGMDNGNLLLTEDEKNEMLKTEPLSSEVIKQHMSAEDFLNNKKNYCLWFHGVNVAKYKNCKELMKRIDNVREYRSNSNRAETKKMADYPYLFAEIRQPTSNYIMLPVVSSEKRKYIPIAYLSPEIILSYASISIPNATLFHFGVLTSNVHMAWMRVVCGRLKSDYRYSTSLVYNNFPWCEPTEEQKKKIEQTAQAILDARAKYPDSSLADLYDETTMPVELRKAHQENDKAVMQAYGFWGKLNTESECVAELFKMYQTLVGGNE